MKYISWQPILAEYKTSCLLHNQHTYDPQLYSHSNTSKGQNNILTWVVFHWKSAGGWAWSLDKIPTNLNKQNHSDMVVNIFKGE